MSFSFFDLLSVLGTQQYTNTIAYHYKAEIKAVNLFIPLLLHETTSNTKFEGEQESNQAS